MIIRSHTPSPLARNRRRRPPPPPPGLPEFPPRPTTLPEMPVQRPPANTEWQAFNHRGVNYYSRSVFINGQSWVESINGTNRWRVRLGGNLLKAECQAKGHELFEGVQVFGALRRPDRARLRGAIWSLPPACRPLLQNLYVSENLGQRLDFETGKPMGGHRIMGLADSSSVILDRSLFRNSQNLAYTLAHELGHLLDLRTPRGRFSNHGNWGAEPFLSSYATTNPQEDFAETHAFVLTDWERLIALSPERWAREPAAEKKKTIFAIYGIQLARHATSYQGYNVA